MLSYIGGKNRQGCWLRDYVPTDTKTYVEVFGGMMWVFLKMDLKKYKNIERVIYNDIRPQNINLWRCVKDYNKLYEVSKNIPVEDSDLFKKWQKEVYEHEYDLSVNDYEMAYKYAYLLSQVWSGTNPSTGNLIKNGGYIPKGSDVYRSKFEIWRKKLIDPKFQNYIDKITVVEGLDYKEVIEKYDSPETYFYIDPPYYNCEHYYTENDFGLDDHIKLAKQIDTIKGMFTLSYYEFDLLKEWYPYNSFTPRYHWHKKAYTKNAGATKDGKQNKSVELIINNFYYELN